MVPLLIAGATFMKVQAERAKTAEQVALAKHNAAVERQKAEQIRRAEQTKQEQIKIDRRRLLSQQKVGFAKGGVITTTGTPLTVGLESVARIEFDAITSRHNADIKASQRESQAEVFEFKAKSAKRAGKFAVGTALFTGGLALAATRSKPGTETEA